MSPEQQKGYILQHPGSKYAKATLKATVKKMPANKRQAIREGIDKTMDSPKKVLDGTPLIDTKLIDDIVKKNRSKAKAVDKDLQKAFKADKKGNSKAAKIAFKAAVGAALLLAGVAALPLVGFALANADVVISTYLLVKNGKELYNTAKEQFKNGKSGVKSILHSVKSVAETRLSQAQQIKGALVPNVQKPA